MNYFVIPGIVEQNNSYPPIQVISNIVQNYYRLSLEELYNLYTRKRKIVFPRQVVMYLARTVIRKKIALRTIGGHFGLDHSTALYAIKTVSDIVDTNKQIKEEIEELTAKCKEVLR